MKNIFIFIRRYFTFICFIILQIVSIVLLVSFNNTHQAAYAGIANEVTGVVNDQFNKVQNYFHLRENNRLLLEENKRLKNVMGMNFETPDTTRMKVLDSLYRDTTGKQRRFIWLPAKVVNNSVALPMNYITLHRGAAQGVKKDMAVIGSQGIVGIVVDVSDNYAKVMSVLNRNTKVSSMLKKNNITGSVEWDGESPRYVTLKGIPKTTTIAKGDTVVTSRYSANFPPNIVVGTVEEVKKDPVSNYFVVKVRTATNFYTLEYVYLIENIQLAEQQRLEETPVRNQ